MEQIPENVKGLEAFLASPYVKGVGKVYARRLAEVFGMRLLDPEFDFSEMAVKVPGLGPSKIEELRLSLRGTDPTNPGLDAKGKAALMLYSAGFSDIEAEKVLAHYGRKALEALSLDPYDMVENAWKVSFFTADKLGRLLGIASDDPRRIAGALLAAVRFYAEKGHLFATRDQAVTTAANLTGAPRESVERELDSLIADGRLVGSRGGIYLPVYYTAEKEAARKLTALIRKPALIAEDFEIPSADISGNPLNEDQISALRAVMENPVTVITGGPGTGKTTTVRGIISLFEGMGRKAVLAAPTGRAAKRMSDLAGAEAKTIHRLLGYNMGRGYRNKRFDADILVIDEASMLEQVLFNHLLDAIGEGVRVVLVGDTNQLPPIGAGDVLNDLIASGAVPVVTLRENFRQKEGSAIAANAEAIKAGEAPGFDEAPDFLFLSADGSENIHALVLSLVAKDLPEKYGIDPKDIQVVTPQNDGPLGAKELNLAIQQRVNSSAEGISKGQKTLRLGDRVMQTSNSSARDVYNGETGWISAVDVAEGWLEVTFHDGKKRIYTRDRLGELNLAYAMTVHKLQGSETDYMVMLLTTSHRQMLYRNLLYTGISRARKLCVLVGEEKAVTQALANTPSTRNSNFRHRLSSER